MQQICLLLVPQIVEDIVQASVLPVPQIMEAPVEVIKARAPMRAFEIS